MGGVGPLGNDRGTVWTGWAGGEISSDFGGKTTWRGLSLINGWFKNGEEARFDGVNDLVEEANLEGCRVDFDGCFSTKPRIRN